MIVMGAVVIVAVVIAAVLLMGSGTTPTQDKPILIEKTTPAEKLTPTTTPEKNESDDNIPEEPQTVEGCKKLGEVNLTNACLSVVAMKEKNATICEMVSTDWQSECYQNVAHMFKDNITKCKGMTDNTTESCLELLAMKTKNPYICTEISEKWQNECYNNVAVASKDAIICGEVKGDNWLMNYCKAYIANETKSS